MPSGTAARRNRQHARAVLAELKQAQRRRTRRNRAAVTVAVLAAIGALVAGMMLTSQPTVSSATRVAPDFTLTDTTGAEVSLAGFRGRPVVLYFNEGAGCGSCLVQMNAIEQEKADFEAAGITVLPIVMNTRDQITNDMRTYGTKTPFLLDDGTVSRAYGTLGNGMHAGLPGHSFVLVDGDGEQRWKGEFPSMWLAPDQLLEHVEQHLS
jgi:peroxiredoxin